MATKAINSDVESRFQAKYRLNKYTFCWDWKKPGPKGYGHFRGGIRSTTAHRWSYEHYIDRIPDGMQIDHVCRNRRCVNPFHLEPVTCADNLARSDLTQASINSAKTSCVYGHEFTSENIYWHDGFRQCRKCKRNRDKKYREGRR